MDIMIAAVAVVFVIALIVLLIVLCRMIAGQKKAADQYQKQSKRVFVKSGVNIKKQMLGEEKGEYFTGNLEDEGTYFVNGEMRAWRMAFDNLRTGQRIYMNFSGQMWIGRDESGQTNSGKLLLTGDNKISRNHCTIYETRNALCIQDLNSSNHTYLNGNLLSSAAYLKNGDVLRLGDTELRVQYELLNSRGDVR